MDAGSFVYEADGVRWAQEIGWNNYDNFLSRGMKLWNTEQDSDRWKIFCIGPFSHNILLIDGQLQAAKHKAHILECTENSVVVELSDLYEGRADRVTRSFRLNPDRSVDITDGARRSPAGLRAPPADADRSRRNRRTVGAPPDRKRQTTPAVGRFSGSGDVEDHGDKGARGGVGHSEPGAAHRRLRTGRACGRAAHQHGSSGSRFDAGDSRRSHFAGKCGKMGGDARAARVCAGGGIHV